MKDENFIYKTQISFMIGSDDVEIDPISITEDLQLKPSRFHRKGDTYIGKNTGLIGTKARTVWAIDTDWTILEEETVSHHIEFLKKILLPKIDVLKKYKEDERFDVCFWIWIETENAGIGFCFQENELKFLNSISNWVHFSLNTNQKN